MFRVVPLLAAVVLLAVSSCSGGEIVFSFSSGDDGGFSAADSGLANRWFFSGSDWRVNGTDSANRTLMSPTLTASGGPVTVTVAHVTSFETGWDGGVLAMQVSGSPIVRITDFSAWGYNDNQSAASFPSGNAGPAWTGTQTLDSVANAGSLTAGTEFILRFEAGWDVVILAGNPAWRITSVTVSGVETRGSEGQVPEPSTGLLVLAGVALLWRMSSRRAT